jgi:hypothetical protein
MYKTVLQGIITSFRMSFPKAIRIAWWMIRLTVLVSLCVEILRYFGLIAWMSESLSPVFRLVGLPGESALAFLTGYFVNVYGALAVIGTLSLSVREVTLLGVMILCAHNMFVETAVQKKTGSSALRMVCVRTLGALAGGFLLHWLLPGGGGVVAHEAVETVAQPLSALAAAWAVGTLKLIVRMFGFIVLLSFLQRLLAEFGVIRWIAKFLRPLLRVFGLPAKTSFLWIVANILGLAYGAAVMIEETEYGKIGERDVDLLNHHIAVSHSNLEDLLLIVSFGGMFWWLLLSRWFLSIIFVWERRLEWYIRRRP